MTGCKIIINLFSIFILSLSYSQAATSANPFEAEPIVPFDSISFPARYASLDMSDTAIVFQGEGAFIGNTAKFKKGWTGPCRPCVAALVRNNANDKGWIGHLDDAIEPSKAFAPIYEGLTVKGGKNDFEVLLFTAKVPDGKIAEFKRMYGYGDQATLLKILRESASKAFNLKGDSKRNVQTHLMVNDRTDEDYGKFVFGLYSIGMDITGGRLFQPDGSLNPRSFFTFSIIAEMQHLKSVSPDDFSHLNASKEFSVKRRQEAVTRKEKLFTPAYPRRFVAINF